MASLTPHSPLRADTRYILKLIKVGFKSKADPRPSEVRRVSRVFSKAGGSWGRVFEGSIEDIALLKRIIKVAIKKGYMTKREKWV